MMYFVGLDVSVQETAVCVVDKVGKVICERKVPTEPDDIVALLTTIDVGLSEVVLLFRAVCSLVGMDQGFI